MDMKVSINHVFALDLGTQTGWALIGANGSITSGTQSFKPQRFEGGGMRFLRFKRWLTEMKQCTPLIELVVFEEVRRHAGVDAAHAYGGFMGQLTAWCEHHQIPYQGIPVGTIKKHATGRGNASKEEMIDAIRSKGHHPTDDNEADAIALAYLARELNGSTQEIAQ
jgi:Holliday junction resolvasome RuvABC endonuclease subunit